MPSQPAFRIGQAVTCGETQRHGIVLDIRGGQLRTVRGENGEAREIVEYTTPRMARDAYGFYLVEFRSAGGGASQSYWLEEELRPGIG